jgi:hypothetical protein
MLKQLLGLTESIDTSNIPMMEKYRITTSQRHIIFIPVTTNTNIGARERDEAREYCELKTGLKFSIDMSYEGHGIAVVVDTYSIVDKLKGI